MEVLAILAITIALLLWLANKTQRARYSLPTALVRAVGLVLAAQCVAMSVQLLYGSIAYVADGPLEIGFPRIFYKTTVWVDTPIWKVNEIRANAWFWFLAVCFYTATLLIGSKRPKDGVADEQSASEGER